VLEAEIFTFPANPYVSLLPPRSIISITAFHGKTADLNTALGVTLPLTPRRITADSVDYLWSGPDSWLAMADDQALAACIAAAAPYAAITEQSDGKVIFRVTGPHARENLAKLIPIDLQEDEFPPDATALTLAGHLSVQIWREDNGFYLACFRSFAKALYESLVHAAGAES
jgi:sarcosine oxidase subunit gamma